MTPRWTVVGNASVTDGYNDSIDYEGNSLREVLRAIKDCRQLGLQWSVTYRGGRS